jgi:hypothetical protein
LAQGIISKTAGGDIDPDTQDARVHEHKFGEPPPPNVPKKHAHIDAGSVTPHDIDAAKLKETAAKADKARMIADELAGKLVPVSKIEQEIARGFGALKVRILTLGDRLAQRVAAMDDPQIVRTTIEAECRELLEAAAKEIGAE